jgi:hypothetical protein
MGGISEGTSIRAESPYAFDDILEQAIRMLQRRGRLAYRTLKRQFHLDDEALEDLKFTLIEGQRLAADEHGTVLVWTGASESAQAVASQPYQTIQQPTTQEESPPQVEPPAMPTDKAVDILRRGQLFHQRNFPAEGRATIRP